jgi:hypothetical protein
MDDAEQIAVLRARLNRDYETYVRLYGPINRFHFRPTGRTDPRTGEKKTARITPSSPARSSCSGADAS